MPERAVELALKTVKATWSRREAILHTLAIGAQAWCVSLVKDRNRKRDRRGLEGVEQISRKAIKTENKET